MPVPVIQSIASLRNLPVFPDDGAVSGSPHLRRYNLVYGFNGCGKTTLSRLFACLGTGTRHKYWIAESTFSVILTDGTKVRAESVDPALNQRVLVFNTDYVSENFRWNDGEANPIFFLGHDQKDLSEEVDSLGKRLVLIDGRLRRISSICGESRQAFAQHKRDRARLIESEVGLGRRYNAASLESDYARYTPSDGELLNENDIAIQKQVLKMDDPLPKLPRIREEAVELDSLIQRVNSALLTTIGTISIEAVRDHDAMLPWIRNGLEYHKAHALEFCLLCGNVIIDERVRLLEETIDDRFDTLINEVAATKQAAHMVRTRLTELKSGLASTNDVVRDQQVRFTNVSGALRTLIESGQSQLDRVVEILIQKEDSPNSKVAARDLPELATAHRWMLAYTETARSYNAVIDSHNNAHDNFTSNQRTAKQRLKEHYLAEGHQVYHQLAGKVAKAERVHDALQGLRGELLARIADRKQQMRQHGPAADRINTMIHKYLGHCELEIAAKDEGYEILRSGKVTAAAPSEGEKTAIALSYFLVSLEADGRKREDLIVVMDDPISSLDTRSLNYACSLIKSIRNVAQLIVLTHNPHVLNELKKWLRNQTEKGIESKGGSGIDATAALLFIDTVQPEGNDSRRSCIVELPKYLRDYESEYHYLFHMILRFLDSEEDRANYFFVIPNVLRKVLEVFLAFKRPGPAGLSSKIEALAQEADDIGIDQVRLQALDRLANVESHGDNIDDLVTVSSMTIEEAKDAAETLLALIDRLDSEHGRRMRRQCRPTA